MKYKDFSLNTWNQIQNLTEKVLNESPGPHYAAFDADGTLWDMDMGEAFFDFQIKKCGLKGLPPDPWQYYNHEKEFGDTRKAYLWLAQINKGQTLKQVHAWAKQCKQEIPNIPLFPAQQKLIEYFQSKSVEIFIVTASVKWAVEPAADLYGIDYAHVMGIETETTDGIVTDKQKGNITWREGKAERILQMTGGKKPFFACGNTMGDFHLLECASEIRLAVASHNESEELFKTETQLTEEAQKRHWLHHRFR